MARISLHRVYRHNAQPRDTTTHTATSATWVQQYCSATYSSAVAAKTEQILARMQRLFGIKSNTSWFPQLRYGYWYWHSSRTLQYCKCADCWWVDVAVMMQTSHVLLFVFCNRSYSLQENYFTPYLCAPGSQNGYYRRLMISPEKPK